MFDPPVTSLIWCYGAEDKSLFKEIKRTVKSTKFVAGFPEDEIEAGTLFTQNKKGQNLLVFDDLMSEVADSAIFANIWTKVSGIDWFLPNFFSS